MLVKAYTQSVIADNFIFIGLSIIVVKCEDTLCPLRSPSLTDKQCIPTRFWQRKMQCLDVQKIAVDVMKLVVRID